VIRAKRERCFLYRFTDGVRTWQRTSDIPANARNRKKAERQAAELENEFTEAGGVEIEWAEAIVRYNTEHLEGLSSSYRSSFHSAAEALKVSANPYFAADITSADLSTFTAELRNCGRRASQRRPSHPTSRPSWRSYGGLTPLGLSKRPQSSSCRSVPRRGRNTDPGPSPRKNSTACWKLSRYADLLSRSCGYTSYTGSG